MKRSKEVPAALVIGIAAALLTGCSSPREVRRCLDDQGRPIDDRYCDSPRRYPYRGIGGAVFLPRYGYGGSLRNGRVSGYTPSPSGRADVVTPGGRTIQRGGFGSSGRSSGRSGGFFGG